MKLRAKLLLGFAALICVIIALGALGAMMFKRVGVNMSALSDRSLPVLRGSTGVEREALKTLIREKESLLAKTEEASARTRESLKELGAQVGSLTGAASRSGNADSSSQAAEIQKLTAEYAQLYDETSAALRRNAQAERSMDEAGARADVGVYKHVGVQDSSRAGGGASGSKSSRPARRNARAAKAPLPSSAARLPTAVHSSAVGSSSSARLACR